MMYIYRYCDIVDICIVSLWAKYACKQFSVYIYACKLYKLLYICNIITNKINVIQYDLCIYRKQCVIMCTYSLISSIR